MTTRWQGWWHSQRGGEDFLRKLLSSLLYAMLKLVSWSFLRQESSLNTPAQGFNLFLTLLSTYRKTLFFSLFFFFLLDRKTPFSIYWKICHCPFLDRFVHAFTMILWFLRCVCVCERVRDPTAQNKDPLLNKPNKWFKKYYYVALKK